MPAPESSRKNLEYARCIGRVKFWRSPSESQRIKAEIVWLHETKPGLSQRAIARQFWVSQPYIARLLKRVRLMGTEEALGPEAYRHFTGYRDAELRERSQSIAAEWRRSLALGGSTPQQEVPTQDYHGSIARTQAEPARQERPTQHIELVRTTSGDLIELYDLTRTSAQPCDAQPPQRAGIPIRRIWGPGREQTDALLREWAGITGSNRGNSWF